MSNTKINLIWIVVLALIIGFSAYTLNNMDHSMGMEGDMMMDMNMSGDHMEGMEQNMENMDMKDMPMEEGMEGDTHMDGMNHDEMMGAPDESM